MIQLHKKAMLLGLLGLALLPVAKADEWNQKTIFTFTGPVEIPGQVLPAGTYVFKLLNSSSNRHIVQVFNQDENQVFGTFLAIPDFHLQPASEPIIKFHERAEGSPEAIKAWFYPGRNYGHEFVYPKREAVTLAKANDTPVPAMQTDLTPTMINPSVELKGPEILVLVQAPLMAEKPTGEEVQLAEAFDMVDTHAQSGEAERSEELPATASWLPVFGVAGILLLGSAGTLRLAAARAK